MKPEDTVVRLGPLALYRFNLALTCLEEGCGHRGVLNGERLFYWFAIRQMTDEFEKVRKRLICSACGSRRLSAVATRDPDGDTLPPADPASPVMNAFVMGGGRPIPICSPAADDDSSEDMCNRARLRTDPETLREKFGATWAAAIPNKPAVELYPNAPAPVIRSADSQRIIDMMKWGVLPPNAKKNPGTNVRMLERWRRLAEDPAQRCLVPLTEFCEWLPEKVTLGDGKPPVKGEMWFAVPDQPLFAVAGFWRQLGEDRTFAMVTCEPNELVAPIHPKAMITILAPEDHDRWLTGSYDDVVALQQPYPAERMTVRGPVFPTRGL